MTPTGKSTPSATQAQADQVSTETMRLIAARGDLLLNAVDEGICCLDAQGNISFVNEAAARALGYTMREMTGKPMHELTHHHYPDGTVFPREECPIWGSVTEGIHQRIGGDVFWRKDGSALPVDFTSVPIREGRRVVAVVVTFRDVTAQQAARAQSERFAVEQAARLAAEASQRIVKQRDERFRGLIAASGQIVWTNSPEGRMSGDQPGWSGYTGQTPEEYEGFGWAAAVHPDDAQASVNEWNACVTERRPFVFEHRVRGRDGTYRHFSIRAIPLLDDDGSIREWVGVHTDITEQREARVAVERALADAQHARLELQRAFEQAPAAIATLVGENLTFASANPKFRTLLGNRELIGFTMLEAVPEMEGQPFLELMRNVYRTGEAFVGRQVQASVDHGPDGKPKHGVYDFVYQPLRDADQVVTGIMIHAVESMVEAVAIPPE